MTIELQFDDKATRELLNAVVQNITNPQPVLNEIGQMMLASVKENFEVGGAYSSPDSIIGGNKKWKPLSKTTKKIKARQGKKGPYQILADSGRLRDSITSKADKVSVTVGTNVEYAAVHQFGAKKGEFGIVDVLVKAHVRNLTREEAYMGTRYNPDIGLFGKREKIAKIRKRKLKSSVRGHFRKQPVPFGDIPARPFMTIHPDMLNEIDQVLINFILSGRAS